MSHLPYEQHEREVPGHDGSDDSNAGPGRHFLRHELGPASVVVEVPHHHQTVGVSGLPDGLPVVQGLHYGYQPGVFLDVAGHTVEVLGSLVPSQLAPGHEGLSCCLNCSVDILGSALADITAGRQQEAGLNLPEWWLTARSLWPGS